MKKFIGIIISVLILSGILMQYTQASIVIPELWKKASSTAIQLIGSYADVWAARYCDETGANCYDQSAGAPANTALSNLASVAVNTSLISDTAATDNLGSEALFWLKAFLGSSISFEGTTDDTYQTTLTATDTTLSDKTITLPNATGTVALTTDKLSAFAATSSAELAGVLSDESGSGLVAYTSSPVFTTPSLGAATGTTLGLSATGSLTLGTASSAAGQITLNNATNANTVILQPGVTSGSYTMTLPLAVGGAGTVLTDAAGDGSLSWAAAGGGGAFGDWKSICAAGCDYTDVQAMITGGFYKGYLNGAVTEDSDIAPDANGLMLHLNNFTLTMAAYQIVPSAADSITIEGSSPDLSIINYTQTTIAKEFIDSTTSVVVLRNLKFDNNSSATSTSIVNSGAESHIDTVIFEPPNIANSYTYINVNDRSTISNCVFIAPGITATNVFVLSGGSADNISFDGTWTNTNDTFVINDDGTLNNLLIGGDIKMSLNGGIVTNVQQAGGTFNIDVDADDCVLQNVVSAAGTLVSTTSMNDCTIENVDMATWTLSTSGNRNTYIGNSFGNAVTIEDDRGMFIGNYFETSVIITGDGSSFSDNYYSSTIAVNEGAIQNQFNDNYIGGAVTITGDNSHWINNNYIAAVIIAAAANGTQMSGGNYATTFASTGTNDLISNSFVVSTFTIAAGGDYGQYLGMNWDGAVSITSDYARYSGFLNTAETFTIVATGTGNMVDVTIDQVVADSGTGSVISEIVY